MSVDSFFSAVSDVTNANGITKGRFKVVHIEETDEGTCFKSQSISVIYRILVPSISETQPQQSLVSLPPVTSQETENTVETDITTEKGAGFLKNLYDYQGGTFTPIVNDLVESPASSSSAQLSTLFGVFLPCVQNIIGVIIFIRLYWVVGVSGIIEGMIIIGLCCLCTFLTAISLAASEEIYVK
jgi:hypothetical protein